VRHARHGGGAQGDDNISSGVPIVSNVSNFLSIIQRQMIGSVRRH